MTIYSHPKRPKSSKYVSFISKIEPPEFAQLEPSRKAPEARFVGVAERLQNKLKSIKMTMWVCCKQSKRPVSSNRVGDAVNNESVGLKCFCICVKYEESTSIKMLSFFNA